MTRKDFLKTVGLGAGFALTATCLGSCSKEYVVDPIDEFTVDLSLPQNATLNINGNYKIINSVVVAKGLDGKYYAATVWCSHEERSDVIYDKNNDEFLCTEHDARFDLNGNGLNTKAKKGLKIYDTILANNILTIKAG